MIIVEVALYYILSFQKFTLYLKLICDLEKLGHIVAPKLLDVKFLVEQTHER